MGHFLKATVFTTALLLSSNVYAQCVGANQRINNLSDVCSTSTARTNLGADNASNLTTGTVSVNRFNSGTGASTSTYLRGDGTWVSPTGSLAAIATSGSAADLTTGTAAIGRIPTGTTTSSSTVPLNNDGRLNETLVYLPIGSPTVATTAAAPAADMVFSGPLTYSIPASTAPVVGVGANPASTLSIILKKNGSTLCTISLSTGGTASGCSISATSFVTGDRLTAETGADASATGIGVSIRLVKSN